jgi:erythromycin esterase-like protein
MQTLIPHDRKNVLRGMLAAYEEFLQTTVLLCEALQQGAMAQVTHLLEEREQLVFTVDHLDQLLNRGEGGDASPPSAEATKLLGRVAMVNQECEKLAQCHCARLAHDVEIANQALDGLHGYAVQRKRPAVFLNVNT